MTSVRPGRRDSPRQGDGPSSRKMAIASPSLNRGRLPTQPSKASTSVPPGKAIVPGRIPETTFTSISLASRQSSSIKPSAHSRLPLVHESQPWGSVPKPSAIGRPSQKAATTPAAPLAKRTQSAAPAATASGPRYMPYSGGQTTAGGSQLYGRSRSRSREPKLPPTQIPLYFDRAMVESPVELPSATAAEVTSTNSVRIYPELDRYRNIQPASLTSDSREVLYSDTPSRVATQRPLLPPTPQLSGTSSLGSRRSASPSTRFSESPGPSTYSRDTTPTSISSQSPRVLASTRGPLTSRTWKASRGRSSSLGRDSSSETVGLGASPATPSLAAIRESVNSSSSSCNGTVCRPEKKERRLRKNGLSSLPPSPPPRKSSQKFRHQGGVDGPSAQRQERLALPPLLPSSPEVSLPAMTPIISTHEISAPSAQTQTDTPPRQISQQQPPPRPSRDGAPDLQAHLGLHMPIIQSNLATGLLSSRRTSLTSIALPPTHQFPNTQQKSTTAPDPAPSRAEQASHPHPSRLPLGREQTGNRPSEPVSASISVTRGGTQPTNATEHNRTTRTPSPGVSTFRTRFPLFRGRYKATTAFDTAPTIEMKEKAHRKGPAAGTGHEGYGRPRASQRRSSSASSHASGGFASSEESLESPRFPDPFLSKRLSPVVIAGGEVVENRNPGMSLNLSRTNSNTSAGTCDKITNSYNDPQTSLSPRGGHATLWPSPIPHSTRQASSSNSQDHAASNASDSESAVMQSTLAFRRSVQRRRSPDQAQALLPKPIVVRQPNTVAPPSVNSIDTGILSDDSLLDSQEARRGHKDSVPSKGADGTKKLTKRTRPTTRKWNLFGRSQSQPAVRNTKLESASTVAVTVSAGLQTNDTKPVAFYTIIDSSGQEDEDVDVEDVLREARVFRSPPPTYPKPPLKRVSPSLTQPQEDASLLPPELSTSSSTSLLSSTLSQKSSMPRQIALPPNQSQPSGITELLGVLPRKEGLSTIPPQPPVARNKRPSRLPQVGRIPKVVNVRPEPASPRSFSRPFNQISVQAPSTSLDINSISTNIVQTPKATTELGSGTGTFTSSFTEVDRLEGDGEFLVFSPRKDSQATTCTTSSTSGLPSFANATAVVPDPDAPLAEDEIWDEYNDLLGEEGFKIPLSAGSSHGLPFHLEEINPQIFNPRTEVKQIADTDETLESPTIIIGHQAGGRHEADHYNSGRTVPSSVYSSDLAARVNEVIGSRPSPPLGHLPPTPFSVSEFVSGYSDRDNDAGAAGQKPTTSQRSSGSSQRSWKRKIRQSDGSVYSQVSEDHSPAAQVNLRVGSMTVSKWLTFGHVLFSPARDDMIPAASPPNGHAVLVIDGLGNDDWSFYAAETYPAATFFNLSPRAPLPVGQQGDVNSFPISPHNHHQIQYASHADRLPFLSEMFTTVVYRFPTAAPESHHRNIINEARRVLKPGGYLELSILDLDLNNMGNRTRRAVRRLKEQIHSCSPNTHLGSTADIMLRLLGKRGFTDIKSCRVGIPVASTIPPPSSSAIAGTSSRTQAGDRPRKDNRSLAEMISDDGPVADESITSMVARVGRWWHSCCYGDAAAGSFPGSAAEVKRSASMWTDCALLAECAEWRTNLKMMVCYARVPDGQRVASI